MATEAENEKSWKTKPKCEIASFVAIEETTESQTRQQLQANTQQFKELFF